MNHTSTSYRQGEQNLKQVEDILLTLGEGIEEETQKEEEDKAVEKKEASLLFTRLGDLFKEPEESVAWLVDGILPAGGFSVLAGKPKGGKSTLARNTALHVAQGRDFLGRKVKQGPILYLALEEKRSEVKSHFRDMGASGEEDIFIFASTAPINALRELWKKAEEVKPALVIIDPLFRFTRVKDANDYAQVTQALEPLLKLARETNTHVMVVHHTGKGNRQGGDSILGSSAIFGSVDTALILKRGDKYRTLQTQQRYGQDLEETTLEFDDETRTMNLGQSREEADIEAMEGTLVQFLQGQEEPLPEAEISGMVEGRKFLKVKALRSLVNKEVVTRDGKGGKSDPFKYSCSLVPDICVGTRKQEPENARKPNNGEDYSCSQDSHYNDISRGQEKVPSDEGDVEDLPEVEVLA
jgi:predicted ATP-dependent serine protease